MPRESASFSTRGEPSTAHQEPASRLAPTSPDGSDWSGWSDPTSAAGRASRTPSSPCSVAAPERWTTSAPSRIAGASPAAPAARAASGGATATTPALPRASAAPTAGAARRAASARADEASSARPATATGRQPRPASARATAVPARPGPTSAKPGDGLVASTLRSLSFRSLPGTGLLGLWQRQLYLAPAHPRFALRHPRGQQRVELGERHHHERPLVQTGMGDDEVVLVDVLVADQEHIDVERTRSPSFARNAAGLGLQPLGDLQQLPGCAVRLDGDDGVEVVGLLGPADRRRLVDRRHRGDRHTVGGGEPVDGELQRAGPVVEVGPQAEVRPPRSGTRAGVDRVLLHERVGVVPGQVVADALPQVLGGGDVGAEWNRAHDGSLLAITDPHDDGALVGDAGRVATAVGRLDPDHEPVPGPHLLPLDAHG